ASVNDCRNQLLVVEPSLNKYRENHVDDFMRPCVFSVDLVDYDDWLEFVFKRLAQNKARLRLWPVVGVDNQKYAVHHFHDALHFAAEVSMAGCIDNVDAVAVPLKSRILRADRDSFFTLEIHRIHY